MSRDSATNEQSEIHFPEGHSCWQVRRVRQKLASSPGRGKIIGLKMRLGKSMHGICTTHIQLQEFNLTRATKDLDNFQLVTFLVNFELMMSNNKMNEAYRHNYVKYSNVQ